MRKILIVVSVAAFVAVCSSFGQQPKELSMFMRAKLDHSQQVLEGLVSEDLMNVAKHAQTMGLLSQDASWKVIQTSEYAQRSAEFRRSCEALTEAAEKGNLDGATLAYVDVTLKCVDCHKYVRRIRHARLDEPLKSR